MFDRQPISSAVQLGIVRFVAGVGSGPPRMEEAAPWIDSLLNEALDESFPASDPVSSLRFD